MNINVRVKYKIAQTQGAPVIICGNKDYRVAFIFDSEWDNLLAKTARFTWNKNGEKQFTDVDFTGSTVDVPVLADIEAVYVGVTAGDLHTTTPAKIACQRSILCGDGTKMLKGDPGDAATIKLGTVTTGEPGTDAEVENVGTPGAAVFNFKLPRGAKGEKGDIGAELYFTAADSELDTMYETIAEASGLYVIARDTADERRNPQSGDLVIIYADEPNTSGQDRFLGWINEISQPMDEAGTKWEVAVSPICFLQGHKGATGAAIVKVELIGQNAAGDNVYRMTFDNGVTAEFIAPKGPRDTNLVWSGAQVLTGSAIGTGTTITTTADDLQGKKVEIEFGLRTRTVSGWADADQRTARYVKTIKFEEAQNANHIDLHTFTYTNDAGGRIYRHLYVYLPVDCKNIGLYYICKDTTEDNPTLYDAVIYSVRILND